MDHDLLLVLGLAMLLLSIPSLIAALIDDRLPLVAGAGLLFGVTLAAWGLLGRAAPLNPSTLPHLFFEVLGRYLP